MTISTHLTIPTHLTDLQLVHALKRCAREERHVTAALVAHLAEMDTRLIHLREGYPSLFAYCCEVLRLSESATYKRIEVARAARRHPVLLELLSDGRLNLTTARLLAPHLTADNHQELLESASRRGKRAVEEMLARRFPRPDVASSIRKLPTTPLVLTIPAPASTTGEPFVTSEPSLASERAPMSGPTSTVHPPASAVPRPLCVPLAADRYQIRFTASVSTWTKLCMARELLRHAVPSGDPAEIFERALTALLANLSRTKCAQVKVPRHRTRPDPTKRSRHVPANVRRAVWIRDQGRCAYVSPGRRRCGERGFLEFHHVEPFANGGPHAVENIELRCRAHNAYESLVFQETRPLVLQETRPPSGGAAARPDATTNLCPRDSTGPGASWNGVEGAP